MSEPLLIARTPDTELFLLQMCMEQLVAIGKI